MPNIVPSPPAPRRRSQSRNRGDRSRGPRGHRTSRSLSFPVWKTRSSPAVSRGCEVRATAVCCVPVRTPGESCRLKHPRCSRSDCCLCPCMGGPWAVTLPCVGGPWAVTVDPGPSIMWLHGLVALAQPCGQEARSTDHRQRRGVGTCHLIPGLWSGLAGVTLPCRLRLQTEPCSWAHFFLVTSGMSFSSFLHTVDRSPLHFLRPQPS